MERIIVLIEKIVGNKIGEVIIGIIAIASPLYFLKTLYAVWFGPAELIAGFKSESFTWLVLTIANFSGFLAVVPARKKGRVMQIVTAAWTIEMSLVFIASLVR